MACNKKGSIKQGGIPKGGISRQGDPESFYKRHLVWKFSKCDFDPSCKWSFSKERLHDTFWDTILPCLIEKESKTLSEIFIVAKKSNHPIEVSTLNKDARDRIAAMHLEAEAIHSIRIMGKIRIYGYLVGNEYHILWYDDDHGDNETCVCRSAIRHT